MTSNENQRRQPLTVGQPVVYLRRTPNGSREEVPGTLGKLGYGKVRVDVPDGQGGLAPLWVYPSSVRAVGHG